MDSVQDIKKYQNCQKLNANISSYKNFHVELFANKCGSGNMTYLSSARTSWIFSNHFINVVVFLIILTVCLFPESSHAAEVTDLSRLRSDLLNGYDRHARPIQNHQNATAVRFNLYLKGFDFDEQRSLFTLYSWSVMTWVDAHLKWNPKAYGNISKIHFAAHELWTPDLSVYNNLDKSEFDHFGNTRILAYSSSIVVWVPPTKFQVGCTSDLRNWPVDTQYCHVVLGSWAHDGSQVNIKVPANKSSHDMDGMLPNGEWKMIANEYERHDHYYDCCPGISFPDILMIFTLQRHSLTHKAAVVVPGLAIAVGILIAFWIQPGATERLILILMSIIINTMYLNYIYRILPNNGDSVPLVLLYYRDSLVMASVALVWTICLRYLAATKRTSPVPLPGFIQTFLQSVPAKVLCLDPRPTTGGSQSNNINGSGENPPEGDLTTDSGKLVRSGNPFQEDWAWLAHLLDRVAFAFYLVIYLCFYIALL